MPTGGADPAILGAQLPRLGRCPACGGVWWWQPRAAPAAPWRCWGCAPPADPPHEWSPRDIATARGATTAADRAAS